MPRANKKYVKVASVATPVLSPTGRLQQQSFEQQQQQQEDIEKQVPIQSTAENFQDVRVSPIPSEPMMNDDTATEPSTIGDYEARGFEYRKLDDESGAEEEEAYDTGLRQDIVPAEIDAPVPFNVMPQATTGETTRLLTNEHHNKALEATSSTQNQINLHQIKTDRKDSTLGLEDAEPELFNLDGVKFEEGGVPEHFVRGGAHAEVPDAGDEALGFLRRTDSIAQKMRSEEVWTSGIVEGLPEEGTIPVHWTRDFATEAGVINMEEVPLGRSLSTHMQVRTWRQKVDSRMTQINHDFTAAIFEMQHQANEAIHHYIEKMGNKMALDEISEQQAAKRCLQTGQMSAYHEHQTMANVCAALNLACKRSVPHDMPAIPPAGRMRSPLIKATRDAIVPEVEAARSASRGRGAIDSTLRLDCLNAADAAASAQHLSPIAIADSHLDDEDMLQGKEHIKFTQKVKNAAEEVHEQMEQAAEDTVAEMEHFLDLTEARQHVLALENLADGKNISFHWREAFSHAAAAIATLLHKAHEHPLAYTEEHFGSTQPETTEQQASSSSTQHIFMSQTTPRTPTPSPATGYEPTSYDASATF